jgi:hypothetical protein
MASTVNGYAKDFGYCIDGNTGHLMSVQISMNVGSMGRVTIVEDAVVVRQ